MWTCIAITCSDPVWASAIREELLHVDNQSLLKTQSCIVLTNPVGSSEEKGAEPTLNALMIIIERLCNNKGIENITSDVLIDAHILIIHHEGFQGNNACYWPNGNIFLPTKYKNSNNSGLQSYLESISNVCFQLKNGAQPGVWIVSTNLILSGEVQKSFSWPCAIPIASLFTLKCQSNEAKFCDLVKVEELNGTVQSICCPSDEECFIDPEVIISSGILYLRHPLIELLFSLSCTFPLDHCTYLAEDTGGTVLKLSLFFDLLGPLWIKCKEQYFSGIPENSFQYQQVTNKVAEITKARVLLWDKLNMFKLQALPIDGLCQSNWASFSFEKAVQRSPLLMPPYPQSILPYSLNQSKPSVACLNGFIESSINAEDGKELYIISSSVETSRSDQVLRLTQKAYLINTVVNLDKVPDFFLHDKVCIVGYWIRLEEETKMGRSLFSSIDIPALKCDHPLATVFGLNWSTFFALKGIVPEDIWASDIKVCSLKSARLFPLAEDEESWGDFLWLQQLDGNLSRLSSWRNRKRYSMEDFHYLRDPLGAYRNIRSLGVKALLQAIPMWSGSLMPFLRRACAEHWDEALLYTLDKAAVNSSRKKCCRALATIGDLLALKAGSDGGSRSGPAINNEWSKAFRCLENSLQDGVNALAAQRVKWMDTSERLTRASRHYERAVQIIIRQTVQTVQNRMVNIKPELTRDRPPIGVWIKAECPARIDLSGGWSDTPPICYEMGGSVVNLAILVNGQKPIGARARRIDKFQLILLSDGNVEPLIVSCVDDIMNYSNPTEPGALLKAALVCAGVVKLDNHENLATQLAATLGSGLELHGWSNLPQGSGLGTSSILASALLAVIYSAMGYDFNRSQLIHAVLHIEQLLTTGGGWQDQVGGVMGGFNRGYSFSSNNVQVHVEKISPSERVIDSINQRLLLLHTGKVRLARNLLQNVIRKWYAGDETTVNCFNDLVENADLCKSALLEGNLETLGHAIDVYWSQKKAIAPRCEPEIVRKLMNEMSTFLNGQSLAGAGGGGFYYGMLRRPEDKRKVEQTILLIKGCENMSFYDVSIDLTGISLKIGEHDIHIP